MFDLGVRAVEGGQISWTVSARVYVAFILQVRWWKQEQGLKAGGSLLSPGPSSDPQKFTEGTSKGALLFCNSCDWGQS